MFLFPFFRYCTNKYMNSVTAWGSQNLIRDKPMTFSRIILIKYRVMRAFPLFGINQLSNAPKHAIC